MAIHVSQKSQCPAGRCHSAFSMARTVPEISHVSEVTLAAGFGSMLWMTELRVQGPSDNLRGHYSRLLELRCSQRYAASPGLGSAGLRQPIPGTAKRSSLGHLAIF